MKSPTRYKTLLLCALTSAVGLLALPRTSAAEPAAEALIREAHKLERRALELREAGREDAAERAETEARELAARAERRARENADNAEKEELRRHLRAMALEIRELQEQGRDEDARELTERLVHLRREMAEREPGGGPEAARVRQERLEQMQRERREHQERDEESQPHAEPQPRPRPEMEEAHRRLHHLEVAIENLRAAEMHEPAEQLENAKRQMIQDIERHAHAAASHASQLPPEVIEHLQGQIHELRRAIEELRHRMEELHRRAR